MSTNAALSIQLYDPVDVERFAREGSQPITLHTIRFETILLSQQPTLLADLTIFNGQHFLILFAIPCNFRGADEIEPVFPKIVATLPQTVLTEIKTEITEHWKHLRQAQGTALVNGIIDSVASSGSPLRHQPATATGVAERDIPGRTAYGTLVRAVRAYEVVQPHASGKTVLDYGCGSGLGSLLLAGAAENVLGVDLSPEAIALARALNLKDNATFATVDAMGASLFDMIVAFEVMEHTDDPPAFLHELKSLLATDGKLILSVPNRQYHGTHLNPFHKTDFTLASFAKLMEQHFASVQLFSQRSPSSLNPFETYSVVELADRSDERFVALCQGPKAVGDVLLSATSASRVESSVQTPRRSTPSVKVLMVNRPNALTQPGGDTTTMRELKRKIEELDKNLEVEISLSTHPLADGYDIVHVFNLLCPYWTAPQVQSVDCTRNPRTPIILTPIYWDMSEERWANAAVKAIFTRESGPRLAEALRALAEGRVEVDGATGHRRAAPDLSTDEGQHSILRHIDYLLPGSHAELQRLAWSFGVHHLPFTVVPSGVDPKQFEHADPDLFREKNGLNDFILCVGRLEPRKNQLLLLYALRDLDIPIVLIGATYDAAYRELCQRYAPKRTLFLEHTEGDMLASAYAAARVHAQPSWLETPGIASLEAALCDCSIVVGDRGSEWEYFQDGAHYCNPADVASIRRAVLQAYESYGSPEEKLRRESFKARIRHEFTWQRAAQWLLEAYEVALNQRESRPERYGLMDGSRQDQAISRSATPRSSIIVVTYNSAATLLQCLDSVLTHTSSPFAVIVVDNASTDSTGTLLNDYAQRHPSKIKVIYNEANRGFSAACNQGIQAAQGDYLLLLNPDTIVTEQWLERLVAHFERSGNEDVGAVGPTSNWVAGFQQVGMYVDTKSAQQGVQLTTDTLSRTLAEQNTGRAVETKLLIGFCLALRREAMAKVGPLDEALFLGNEDLDYSLRLRDSGYRLLIATDAFVYHRGQASFSSLDSETKRERMQESVDALYAKLERRFGEGQVPSSSELWGFDIMGVPSKVKRLPEVKVALIYDNRVRPDTTGEYCKRALERLCHVTHYLPDQLNQLSANGTFDLYLRIDDGLDYTLPDHLHPCAWWIIDTHMRYDWYLPRANQCDYVFAAQRDGAERLRGDGIANVRWLPLACEPDMHTRHEVEKVHDVCFVGNFSSTASGERERMLQLIHREFPKHFIGQQYFYEMARTYSQTRIVFNRSIRNDINMRVFEALACGSLLVTNDLSDNGQNDLFLPGQHLVTYQNEQELVEKIHYYLHHEEEREAIAAAGRSEVLSKHTYRHRMEMILGAAGLLRSTEQSSEQVASTSVKQHPSETIAPQREGLSRPTPLVSMIILCWDEVQLTKQCVESVRAHTSVPYELIFVDNGSTDETPAYLKALKETISSTDASCQKITVLTNPTNVGFARGCNQALTVARSPFILLLNNDVVVTEGWLDKLVGLLNNVPSLGAVGPRTNYAGGPQQMMAGYLSMDQMREFARYVADTHRAEWFPVERLVGFCLLVKREALDRVGRFDEQFEIGLFEDDDLCLRLRQAGYQLGVVGDCFVHHFGSRSFQRMGAQNTRALYRANMKRFVHKWEGSAEARKVYAPLFEEIEKQTVGQSTQTVQLLKPFPSQPDDLRPATVTSVDGQKSTVSLCMIVKNEEKNLATCLSSVQDLFDEIIVVDTGSTDRTQEIAKDFVKVKLFEFPWIDDFSAARNVSLEQATSHWVMWLDADDRLDDENHEKLRALFESLPSPAYSHTVPSACPIGYDMKVLCLPDPGGGYTIVDHVKLFPNHPQLRFEYRVHEQILPAIRRLAGDIRFTDIVICHSGYQDRALRQRKLERDRRILESELEVRPHDPFCLFNYGCIAFELKDYATAIKALRESIDRSDPRDSQVRKCYAMLAHSYRNLKDPQRALELCQEGKLHYADDLELLFHEGLIHLELHAYSPAEACLTRILQLASQPSNHFSSIDVGIKGSKTRHNLAIMYAEQGKRQEAEQQWRHTIQEEPAFIPAWLGVAELCLEQQRFAEVERLAAAASALCNGETGNNGKETLRSHAASAISGVPSILLGKLRLRQGWPREAVTYFERAIEHDPESVAARILLTHALLQGHEDLPRAEAALREVIERDGENAEANHNLGALCHEVGRPHDAVVCLRRAIELRSNYAMSHYLLGMVWKDLGDVSAARNSLAEALRLSPQWVQAEQELAALCQTEPA